MCTCVFICVCLFKRCDVPSSAPTLHQPLLTPSFLAGRWSTSGSDRGNAHFFTATSIQPREREEKEENEQTLGVNSSEEGELCNTLCMCRLTLAWVTSETSTKQLQCRLILTRSSSLSLDRISCRLASLLRCPVSTAPVRVPSPTAFELLFPTNSLLASPSTSGHGEISSSKPFFFVFAPKQTKESSAWRATYIVLQCSLYFYNNKRDIHQAGDIENVDSIFFLNKHPDFKIIPIHQGNFYCLVTPKPSFQDRVKQAKTTKKKKLKQRHWLVISVFTCVVLNVHLLKISEDAVIYAIADLLTNRIQTHLYWLKRVRTLIVGTIEK